VLGCTPATWAASASVSRPSAGCRSNATTIGLCGPPRDDAGLARSARQARARETGQRYAPGEPRSDSPGVPNVRAGGGLGAAAARPGEAG
jgi:hypothetical protein